MIEPVPGEVWVPMELNYVTADGVSRRLFHLPLNQPIIITYITLTQIGYVGPGDGRNATTGVFYATREGCVSRGEFNWEDHFRRIWPLEEEEPRDWIDLHQPPVPEPLPELTPDATRRHSRLSGRLGTR